LPVSDRYANYSLFYARRTVRIHRLFNILFTNNKRLNVSFIGDCNKINNQLDQTTTT